MIPECGPRGGLALLGPDNALAEPVIYDYNGYEELAVGILLYSSLVYGEMPDEVRPTRGGLGAGR